MHYSSVLLALSFLSTVTARRTRYQTCYCSESSDPASPNNRLTLAYCDKIKRGKRDEDNFPSAYWQRANVVPYDPEYIYHDSSNGYIEGKHGFRMDWSSDGTEVCVYEDLEGTNSGVLRNMFMQHGRCGQDPPWIDKVNCVEMSREDYCGKAEDPEVKCKQSVDEFLN